MYVYIYNIQEPFRQNSAFPRSLAAGVHLSLGVVAGNDRNKCRCGRCHCRGRFQRKTEFISKHGGFIQWDLKLSYDSQVDLVHLVN